MSNYKNTYDPSEVNTSWALAEDLIRTDSEILEVGAGNGNFAEAMIRNKNCRVDVVEPDAGDAKLARKKVRKLYQSNLEDALPEIKDKYDHIVFLDVIEHLVDPVSTLASIKKLLKPEGTIVFSVPNMAHMSVRVMLLGGDFVYGKTGVLDATHLHYYTKSELERIFTEAGYAIKQIDGVTEDIEPPVLKNELSKYGIVPTAAIKSTLRSNNGMIYQFIGSAYPSTAKKPHLPECSPNLNDIRMDYYQDENARLKTLIEQQQAEIKALSERKVTSKIKNLFDKK